MPVTALLLVLHPLWAPHPAANPDSVALAARINGFVQPYATSNNFTGVILVRQRGRVAFTQGYGMASYELGVRNTAATRFHIASITKAFTAAAVLLLEQQGKLSSSDAVSKHVPDYPGGEKIQIEHLLKHTSGIPNLGSQPEWAREERMSHSIEELVGLFKNRPLEFTPGSEVRYSNSNYNLLALIIENVSGRSYEDFLRENVWTPLGLNTTLDGSDMTRLVSNRAVGTEPEGISGVRLPRLIDWSGRRGSGSVITTASDLDRFVEALFRGKLLQPATLQKILAPAEGFAYGWFRDQRFGRKLMRSAGRSPGFNATVQRYLDDGTTIIVMTNSYSPVAQDSVFVNGLHAAALARPAAPPAISPIKPGSGTLVELAGRFQMPPDYFVPNAILEMRPGDDHLEAVWQDGGRNTVYPVGANQFLDRNFWAEVRFTRDAKGRIDGFTYSLASQRFRATKLLR